MRGKFSWLLYLIRGVWIGLIGLILIFEEWGWDPLARLLARLGDLPGLRWIESLIRALPPYGALAVFGVPVLALFPLKVLALYWLGQGHAVLGLAVIVLAKVGGTALTARLFVLTQATLMRLPWFARWFERWMAWKTRLLATLKTSALWLSIARLRRAVRHAAARLLRRLRRWIA